MKLEKLKKKRSIKADKSADDWVLAIYCDYGTPGKKLLIRASYSLESGERAWERFAKVFGTRGKRCWQENKKGKIVRDTKKT